uniref:Uncharacterized protein n=1 Tax=Arundo donax TaxID=35708 RepID=A0A0A9CRL3_ARUDO
MHIYFSYAHLLERCGSHHKHPSEHMIFQQQAKEYRNS